MELRNGCEGFEDGVAYPGKRHGTVGPIVFITSMEAKKRRGAVGALQRSGRNRQTLRRGSRNEE